MNINKTKTAILNNRKVITEFLLLSLAHADYIGLNPQSIKEICMD